MPGVKDWVNPEHHNIPIISGFLSKFKQIFISREMWFPITPCNCFSWNKNLRKNSGFFHHGPSRSCLRRLPSPGRPRSKRTCRSDACRDRRSWWEGLSFRWLSSVRPVVLSAGYGNVSLSCTNFRSLNSLKNQRFSYFRAWAIISSTVPLSGGQADSGYSSRTVFLAEFPVFRFENEVLRIHDSCIGKT